jgi:hypothetical protein
LYAGAAQIPDAGIILRPYFCGGSVGYATWGAYDELHDDIDAGNGQLIRGGNDRARFRNSNRESAICVADISGVTLIRRSKKNAHA